MWWNYEKVRKEGSRFEDYHFDNMSGQNCTSSEFTLPLFRRCCMHIRRILSHMLISEAFWYFVIAYI